ncbi:MAG: sulfotransferase family protein [Planctomycetota bacterium]
MSVLRINMWSGPRNVSTALMYSFAERDDTQVVDEPLYAHYLKMSGAQHPGRDEVLRAQSTNAERVIEDVILGPCEKPSLFLKQMAHHLLAIDRSFLAKTRNVLLVRDPREMLPSLARNVPAPRLADTGLAFQTALLRDLDRLRQDVPVLDARELLLDPRGVLTELCRRLAIPFQPAMLAWAPGARAEDGVWAKHWYSAVHASSGFQPYAPKTEPLAPRLKPLLDECMPHYEELCELAIRAPTSAQP